MKPVYTLAQSRALDSTAIQELGIPSICLMETASQAVARAVRERFHQQAMRGVVVVCGGGNNGGDGYGVARWLHTWGYPVDLWPVQEPATPDAQTMARAAVALGIRRIKHLKRTELIVDAILGTGLSRPVQGPLAEVFDTLREHSAPVVAVDVPSGLDADTGAVLGACVPAALTVALGGLKQGLFGEPGASIAGQVQLADLGMTNHSGGYSSIIPDPFQLSPYWPMRDPADPKSRSGHLLVVAGSIPMAGAAVLACRAALSVGVGLVTLAVPEGLISRLAALPPEVMVLRSGSGETLEPLSDEAMEPFSAVLAGPGLKGGQPELPPQLAEWLTSLWTAPALPALFDADALPYSVKVNLRNKVMTPHPGEAGRLLGRSATAVQADRFAAVRQLAKLGGTVLLKGRNTLIASAQEPVSINPTGGVELATAGSGDVLAGVIGGLLARGVAARPAAQLGAWVHGQAGNHLSAKWREGWIASDIAHAIPRAVATLRTTVG